jgi:anaerobic magnesium-protoporphyrin IX monomethyl ester cyclase
MILLVNANIKGDCYSKTSEFSAIHPCIDAAILHSYFTNIKRVKCGLINMEADGIDTNTLVRIINSGGIKEVWVICSGSNPSSSTMTMTASNTLSLNLKLRTSAKIVMYGGHPSVLPELTKEQSGCDEVIIGDGIDCDIKEIPIVDWGLINPNKYKAHNWHCFGNIKRRSPYAAVYTSLGCPYNCKFCSVKNLYKNKPYTTRQRNIEDVVQEIVVLNTKFGVENIRILDELFTYNLERVDKFCGLLKSKNLPSLNMWCYSRVDTINQDIVNKLRSVGVNWIAYGFESFDQDTLDLMGKKTDIKDFEKAIGYARNADVNIIADAIAGFPNDSLESLEKTYKFLEDNLFEMINLYPLFNLPGTSLYDNKETDWSKYQLYSNRCSPSSTKYLASSEILKWRDMAFNKYMGSPAYLSMLERKFGLETKEHITRMIKKVIR